MRQASQCIYSLPCLSKEGFEIPRFELKLTRRRFEESVVIMKLVSPFIDTDPISEQLIPRGYIPCSVSDKPLSIVADISEGLPHRVTYPDGYFKDDIWLDVTSISKGKGFQGVVKRHHFGGVGDNSHGQHNRQRAPGSLGGSSWPSRVMKGVRMAGRTGGKKVKVLNLRLVKIIPEHNLLLLKGSVPGAKGSYVIIESPDRI